MRARDLAVNAARAIKETISSQVEQDELRPSRFGDFIGQPEVMAQLTLMCTAARARGEPVDGLLFTGPGGLGKTTLALTVANEMGGELFATTAPTLGPETLGKILSVLKRNSVVFIDEIHGLSRRTAELLYGAMEDGWFDMPTPMGPERRPVKPFTLVGATTDPGKLTDSFKDRFGHTVQLTFYPHSDMVRVLGRSAGKLGMVVKDDDVLALVADRSRGIPRVGNQFLRRIRDYVQTIQHDHVAQVVGHEMVEEAFGLFGIDELGLTSKDRLYLESLYSKGGGPIGLEQLSVFLGEDSLTISKDIEPYLMRLGLVGRAPRGRVMTNDGRTHIRDLLGLE